LRRNHKSEHDGPSGAMKRTGLSANIAAMRRQMTYFSTKAKKLEILKAIVGFDEACHPCNDE